jgi:hypothetical protein
LAESKKTIPKVKNREFYLWMFGNLLTQYFLSCEKDLLNSGVKKFYMHWA